MVEVRGQVKVIRKSRSDPALYFGYSSLAAPTTTHDDVQLDLLVYVSADALLHPQRRLSVPCTDTSQFRTRRLPNSPYLPRTDTTGQRAQAAMAAPNDPNSILMNLADLQLAGSENANAVAKKKSDTLFGPDIGIVSGGPAWTEALRGKNLPADELTVDVVKGWIEKSRKVSYQLLYYVQYELISARRLHNPRQLYKPW